MITVNALGWGFWFSPVTVGAGAGPKLLCTNIVRLSLKLLCVGQESAKI